MRLLLRSLRVRGAGALKPLNLAPELLDPDRRERGDGGEIVARFTQGGAQPCAPITNVTYHAHPSYQTNNEIAFGHELFFSLQQLSAERGDVLSHSVAERRIERKGKQEVDELLGLGESEELVCATLAVVHPDLIRKELGVDARRLQNLLPFPLVLGIPDV